MQVKEIMEQPVIVVSGTDTLEEVAQTLLDNNIGGIPVVDSAGEVTRFINESDFGAKERSIPSHLLVRRRSSIDGFRGTRR